MIWQNYPYTDLQTVNLDGMLGMIQKNAQDLAASTADLQEQINNLIINPIVLQECFLNVKNVGAVGDGITDDSDAFRQALALSRAIYVPEGTFLVSDVNLAGAPLLMLGTGTIKIKAGTDYGFKWLDAPNVTFMGLTFEKTQNPKIVATNDYTSDSNGGAAMWLGSGNAGRGELVAFYGCHFICKDYVGYDWNQYGVFVHVMNLKNLRVVGCDGQHVNTIFRGTRADSVGNGYYATVNMAHILVAGNTFYQLASTDLWNGCMKIDNEPLENNSAFAEDTVRFVNNVFEAQNLIHDSAAWGVGYCKNVYYAGNIIRNYGCGIDVDNPRNAQVIGNKFTCVNQGKLGLRVGTDNNYYIGQIVENVTVANNHWENYESGVISNYGTNVRILDNYMRDVDWGFYLMRPTDYTVQGNRVIMNDNGWFVEIMNGADTIIKDNDVSNGGTNYRGLYVHGTTNSNIQLVDNRFSGINPASWYSYGSDGTAAVVQVVKGNQGINDTINPFDNPSWLVGIDWEYDLPGDIKVHIYGGNPAALSTKVSYGTVIVELPDNRMTGTTGQYPHLARMMYTNVSRIYFNYEDMVYSSVPLKFTVRNVGSSTTYFDVSDAVNNHGLTAGANSWSIAANNEKSFLLYNNEMKAL